MNRITVLPGDYIGPEIMEAGLAVLKAVAQQGNFEYKIQKALFGGEAIDKDKDPLPEETIRMCQNSDAVLLSAIGGPKWDECSKRPEQGLLKIRQALNLFANIRPTMISSSMKQYSPIKMVNDVDFVIVRELTSGIYFGEPRSISSDEAFDTMRYSKSEIERITHIAFKLAEKRRKHVTLVDKANVLATSKFWRKIVGEISKQYPDVTLDYSYVDAATMKIISNPNQFDVILTENLFGDILSDEAAQITGSLGTIPSLSQGDSGVMLYEPIHGSAPDIAGQGIANPFSMINSVKIMLANSFNRIDLADKIQNAVEKVTQEGIVTKDLGGNYTTKEVTQEVINSL